MEATRVVRHDPRVPSIARSPLGPQFLAVDASVPFWRRKAPLAKQCPVTLEGTVQTRRPHSRPPGRSHRGPRCRPSASSPSEEAFARGGYDQLSSRSAVTRPARTSRPAAKPLVGIGAFTQSATATTAQSSSVDASDHERTRPDGMPTSSPRFRISPDPIRHPPPHRSPLTPTNAAHRPFDHDHRVILRIGGGQAGVLGSTIVKRQVMET